MKTEELLINLKREPEMNPDEHDGSYELMREVIYSYSSVSDYSVCNFRDLNAIYLMAIGTWRQNAEKKKENINQSHLPDSEKQRLTKVIDQVWDNACHDKYLNKHKSNPSIGMFGTGFYSFEKKTTDGDVQRFIKMLVEIADLTEDNEIFDKAEIVLKGGIKGMRAASVSVILHCFKPYVFPIINGNMGKGTIYEALGIALDHPTDIETYIANCRKIREYRDDNFAFKNYRIFDLYARKIDASYNDEIFDDAEDVANEYKEEPEEELFDHNIILYGPPGTGKTYSTVMYAVAIIEDKKIEDVSKEAKENYKAVKARYDGYKDCGQIDFITFHQSYGYEDFIEGIRPVLSSDDNEESKGEVQYEYFSGSFKSFCGKANAPVLKDVVVDAGLNSDPVVWKISLKGAGENTIRRECFGNSHIRIGWDDYGPEINDKTDFKYGGKKILNAFMNQMKEGDIVLSLYKNSEIDAVGIITGDYEWSDEYDDYKRLRKVKWLFTDKRENILKINNGATMSQQAVYRMRISPNDVMELVKKYKKPDEIEKPKKYVFIIDEINRGNISKIFGELITLIENTKRLGKPEEAKAILPYSKKEFGVPDNVYILGTMNTADRSIALMDTALRRRFSFEEMMPKPELLKGVIVSDGNASVDIGEMLRVINKRIEVLYDREHMIGHAFFMELRENNSAKKLSEIFKKSVIPLLQEYFYEDYDKIRMVLGDNAKKNKEDQFIVKNEFDWDSDFIGTQPDEIDITRDSYTIMYDNFENIRCYQGIISKL